METGVDNCRELAEYAENLGLKIALELEPFPLSLLGNVKNMVRFIDDVDHPALQANIDVSHLLLADVPPTELQQLQGKAIHVHISDCDGKVHGDLPPGRGVVDFGPYLEEIARLEIDGAVSIELEYSPEPDKIEEWVAEAYQATDVRRPQSSQLKRLFWRRYDSASPGRARTHLRNGTENAKRNGRARRSSPSDGTRGRRGSTAKEIQHGDGAVSSGTTVGATASAGQKARKVIAPHTPPAPRALAWAAPLTAEMCFSSQSVKPSVSPHCLSFTLW